MAMVILVWQKSIKVSGMSSNSLNFLNSNQFSSELSLELKLPWKHLPSMEMTMFQRQNSNISSNIWENIPTIGMFSIRLIPVRIEECQWLNSRRQHHFWGREDWGCLMLRWYLTGLIPIMEDISCLMSSVIMLLRIRWNSRNDYLSIESYRILLS
mgnify:CR=1 FL=1